MRTIDVYGTPKAGEVKVMAFWNGTMMFHQILKTSDWKNLSEMLNKAIEKDEEVDAMINYLNELEQSYYDSYNGKTYMVNAKEALMNLAMINDLVNHKKVVPNDDANGLLIMRCKTNGNTNMTPKKKKRKK